MVQVTIAGTDSDDLADGSIDYRAQMLWFAQHQQDAGSVLPAWATMLLVMGKRLLITWMLVGVMWRVMWVRLHSSPQNIDP